VSSRESLKRAAVLAAWRATLQTARVTGVATMNRTSYAGLVLSACDGDSTKARAALAETDALLAEIEAEESDARDAIIARRAG